jgi:hypothetical protein
MRGGERHIERLRQYPLSAGLEARCTFQREGAFRAKAVSTDGFKAPFFYSPEKIFPAGRVCRRKPLLQQQLGDRRRGRIRRAPGMREKISWNIA